VKGFNQNAIFRMARPLTIRKDIPRGDSAIALAETAPNVFALPTALVTGQTQLRIDTAKYPPAAQTLIAVSTYPTNSTTPTNTTDKDKKPPETRVVTVGDVDFLSNSLYRILGNRDLSLNIVNWLGQSDAQISIRPKDEGSTPLRLTDTDTMKLMFIHIIAFPLLVLCGVFLSFRRRS
jgi:ABC-type uncharacterized transport system involved in gliding motility auxiliary subunit